MLLGGPVRGLLRGPVQGPVAAGLRGRGVALLRDPVTVRLRGPVVLPLRDPVVLLPRRPVRGVPGGVAPALRGVVLAGVVRAARLGAGAPAKVVARIGGAVGRVGPAGQFGPDQKSGPVFLRAPGPAQRVDEKQSPPVLLVGPLWGWVGFAWGAALVAYGYAYGVGVFMQLAQDATARRVHDRVRDQFGYDQSRAVAGVRAHRPAGQPGMCQTPRLGDGTRMCGQLEAEPALGRAPGRGCRGGTETGTVCGVCS